MTTDFLSIRGLRKAFGSVVAVEDVSVDVAEGEFVTFLGPSGSGKSTTLYALAGFQQPSAGDISLRGQSLLSTPSHKRNIGMVFQRYTLFPNLSVGENVAFPLRVRRRASAEIDARVEEMLSLVRLEGLKDRSPAELSGGQQQRVALARALAYDPPVLLMDEPLSALDKKLREEIQTEIRRIHQQTGVTILYVTHDQEEALRLSDRIALFEKGRIVQIGRGEDLYHNPATSFVAGFIGNSNFLSARVAGQEGGGAIVEFPDGARLSGVQPHATFSSGREARLMIRPEHISLAAAEAGLLRGRIRDVTFLGEIVQVEIETSWGEALTVRARPKEAGLPVLAPNENIGVSWEAASSHLFAAA